MRELVINQLKIDVDKTKVNIYSPLNDVSAKEVCKILIYLDAEGFIDIDKDKISCNIIGVRKK